MSTPKTKFYAVRTGHKTGIYTTWSECEAQVKGYPKAQFKSFPNQREAENYLNETEESSSKTSPDSSQESVGQSPTIPLTSQLSNSVDIYVDGSFKNNNYSWAFAAYINDIEIHCDYAVGTNSEANTMRNVAGECAAAMRAVLWPTKQGYTHINLYYDYQGISSWITGEWRTKNQFTQKYTEIIRPYYNKGFITFQKVAGHSGIAGNERADQLANLAFNHS